MNNPQILEQLEIVRKALHTGQISAAKVDAQRAFVEVDQFVKDLLAIVAITHLKRNILGGDFTFSVSGNGLSWAAYVTSGSGNDAFELNAKDGLKPFEVALREAGDRARWIVQEIHKEAESR